MNLPEYLLGWVCVFSSPGVTPGTASAVLSGHQFKSLSSRFQGMNSHGKPSALVTWLPCITPLGQLTLPQVTTPWPGGGVGSTQLSKSLSGRTPCQEPEGGWDSRASLSTSCPCVWFYKHSLNLPGTCVPGPWHEQDSAPVLWLHSPHSPKLRGSSLGPPCVNQRGPLQGQSQIASGFETTQPSP